MEKKWWLSKTIVVNFILFVGAALQGAGVIDAVPSMESAESWAVAGINGVNILLRLVTKSAVTA